MWVALASARNRPAVGAGPKCALMTSENDRPSGFSRASKP